MGEGGMGEEFHPGIGYASYLVKNAVAESSEIHNPFLYLGMKRAYLIPGETR